MSEMRCYNDDCQAETTNGLALCDLCQFKAAAIFEVLPIYFRNLARWRPGSAGIRGVPGSRQPTSGATAATDRVSRALDEAGNAVVTWARALAEDRFDGDLPASGDEAGSVKVACWFLTSNLTSVATLDWCGRMLANLTEHEANLAKLTTEVAPGWYAGACRVCSTDTFVVPGLTWVTCRGCGSTTYASDHIETVLNEARGWVARPLRIAEAIVALVHTEGSAPRLHKRISKWGERGKVATHRATDADGDEVGPKRFRMGDVLDMLGREGETRVAYETPDGPTGGEAVA